MIRRTRSVRAMSLNRLVTFGIASLVVMSAARPPSAMAQEPAQTGTVSGRVVDQEGAAVAGAQVFLLRPAIGTQTRADGGYVLTRVPVGPQILGHACSDSSPIRPA